MGMRLGTATWADPAFIDQNYPYQIGDVWLGDSAGSGEALGFGDDRHVCLVSGSRGGKGASSIINNLCLWPGAVVVIDPKGDNATVTAARRGEGTDICEGMGQAVHVLDPFGAAKVDDDYRSHFNPMDALDPDSRECIDLAGRMADAVVIVREDAKEPFWDEAGREMVKGLILHVLTAPQYEERRNLITVRELLTRGEWEALAALQEMGEDGGVSAHGLLWSAVAKNAAFNGVVSGIGSRFRGMMANAPETFEGVLQVAQTQTGFLDSPDMQDCLGQSDFELGDLKTAAKGVSLYLCLPSRYMNTHYRWLRMMLNLIVGEMEAIPGPPATGYPVLMLLDEFAALRRMEAIEHGVAQMAGFGVKMFFVVQALTQLKAVYKDNWETFLANCGLKLFFNIDENFTREYVCKLIGETEVMREVRSEGASSSESDSFSQSASESASESESEGSSVSSSRSRSENTGTTLSHGRSVSEGTNRSDSRSVSHGENRSTGSSIGESSSTSSGMSFGRGGMSTNFSTTRGRSMTRTSSQGSSDSWSVSQSEGSSRGTSESLTEGASRTFGSGESETDGATAGTTRGSTHGSTKGSTRGSTRGETSGTAETVHKRPLVAPDEIGRFFSRIDDPDNPAYPGFGLALVSGQAPVVYRRSNYYEDPEFIGCFMPHPDYAFSAPEKLEISQGGLKAFESYFPQLTWRADVQQGVVVRRGAVLGYAVQPSNANIAAIRAPVDGRVVRVPGPPKSDLPSNPRRPQATLKELLSTDRDMPVDASTRQYLEQLMATPVVSPELMQKMVLPLDYNNLLSGNFEILHYGTPTLDPFSDLDARCREIDAGQAAEKRRREQEHRLAAAEAERQRLEAERRRRAEQAEQARRAATRREREEELQLLHTGLMKDWELSRETKNQEKRKWRRAAAITALPLLADIGWTIVTGSLVGMAIAVVLLCFLAGFAVNYHIAVLYERAKPRPPASWRDVEGFDLEDFTYGWYARVQHTPDIRIYWAVQGFAKSGAALAKAGAILVGRLILRIVVVFLRALWAAIKDTIFWRKPTKLR